MMAREWLQQSALAVGDAIAALERLDMLRARNGEHSTPKDRRINERAAIALRGWQNGAVEKVKAIQAHVEAGGANEELTAATVLCSALIASS